MQQGKRIPYGHESGASNSIYLDGVTVRRVAALFPRKLNFCIQFCWVLS